MSLLPTYFPPSYFPAWYFGLPGVGSGGSLLDWSPVLDGPYVLIGQMAAVLDANGLEFVHIRWTVTDAIAGTPLVLTGNASVLRTEMAIVHARPQETDWQAAHLITSTTGDNTDGEYSLLSVGVGGSLSLPVGTYRVWGRLTTTDEVFILKAPGYLTVQ